MKERRLRAFSVKRLLNLLFLNIEVAGFFIWQSKLGELAFCRRDSFLIHVYDAC